MSLHDYEHHPRTESRKDDKPVLSSDVSLHAADFNNRLAAKITSAVGTMQAAYVFAVLSLLSLPAVLAGVIPGLRHAFPHWLVGASLIALVGWVSSYFLQLVLLPIIIVGQNVQAQAADKRAQQTYEDAEAVLHEAVQIQRHLIEQDKVISETLGQVQSLMRLSDGGIPVRGRTSR